MEEFDEVTDKLDMLQYYIEHLGKRIDLMMNMVRPLSPMKDFQPPARLGDRKRRIMELLSE